MLTVYFTQKIYLSYKNSYKCIKIEHIKHICIHISLYILKSELPKTNNTINLSLCASFELNHLSALIDFSSRMLFGQLRAKREQKNNETQKPRALKQTLSQ